MEVWGVFSWKACCIFFVLSKLHPLATALLDSDCVWVGLPVCLCVCVNLLPEILCYLLGHKYCVNHNGGLSAAGISPSVEAHKQKKTTKEKFTTFGKSQLAKPELWELPGMNDLYLE